MKAYFLSLTLVLTGSVFSLPSASAVSCGLNLADTGIKSADGHSEYYDPSTIQPQNVCGILTSFTIPEGTRSGELCCKTCQHIFTPILFTAYVAAKKVKGVVTTVEMKAPHDLEFFCGWNPEKGVTYSDDPNTPSDKGQCGIASKQDAADANAACKYGADKNIVLVVGARSMQQCLNDCGQCAEVVGKPQTAIKCALKNSPIDPVQQVKCSKASILSCVRTGGTINNRTCDCTPYFPSKQLKPRVLGPGEPVELKTKVLQKVQTH